MDRFGLRAQDLGMSEQTETYEDVGTIQAFLHDLEARWDREQDRRSVVVTEDEAASQVIMDLPAPPPVVWNYMTIPEKRLRWQEETVRLDQENPNGIPGVGTTNHCVHGDMAITEFILDWKPFQYFTDRNETTMFSFLMTVRFDPLADGGTRLTVRIKPEGTEEQRALFATIGPEMGRSFERGLFKLTGLLEAARQSSKAPAPTP